MSLWCTVNQNNSNKLKEMKSRVMASLLVDLVALIPTFTGIGIRKIVREFNQIKKLKLIFLEGKKRNS